MNIPQSPVESDQLNWQCPNCKQPLNPSAKTWRCANNHSFDVAKSGYVNLLLANQKASKTPGDDQAMLQARQRFLHAGHFQPITFKLIELIRHHFNLPNQSHILDIGCGEGYYLSEISKTLPGIVAGGVDIAKAGLQIAAKSSPGIAWVCASNINLPVADASIDILLRIFAPSSDIELSRVLKTEGKLIVVAPASHHLIEIKQQLYQQPKMHEEMQTPSGFELVNKVELRWNMSLTTQAALTDLLHMTPFYWRGQPQAKQALLQQNSLDVTAHVAIYQFHRKNGMVYS